MLLSDGFFREYIGNTEGERCKGIVSWGVNFPPTAFCTKIQNSTMKFCSIPQPSLAKLLLRDMRFGNKKDTFEMPSLERNQATV